MGGSFRQRLNSEVVAFSTACAVRPLAPAQKRFGEIQESNFLFFVSWPERFYYSIQMKPYATDWCFIFAKIFHFRSLIEKFTDIIMLFNEKNTFLCNSLWYFMIWLSRLDGYFINTVAYNCHSMKRFSSVTCYRTAVWPMTKLFSYWTYDKNAVWPMIKRFSN